MEKQVSTFFILYIILGLGFAFAYALFYHWPFSGFFSPGFYVVIITWPFKAVGFAQDFILYGLSGKPIIF